MNGEKVLAVVNSVSAGGTTGKNWPIIMRQLNEKGVFFDVAMTTGKLHATEITRAALKDGYHKILAVGGDGTTNEIINGFFERNHFINKDAKLAVLSMGTGCDFIRTLQLEKGVEHFIESYQRDAYGLIDIVHIKSDLKRENLDAYFINTCDFGLGGDTCYSVNKTSKLLRGFLSYAIGAIGAILKYKNKKTRLELDGQLLYDTSVNSVFVCNGKYFGGGMQISPLSILNDAQLDVVIIEKANILQVIMAFPKIYGGTHLNHPLVKHHRGKYLKLYFYDVAIGEMDGEQIFETAKNKEFTVEFQLVEAAINILQ